MRIEIVPLILGGLVALVGIGLLFDAWTPDELLARRERRRRARAERDRRGEALLGIGVLAMAAAFLGRDSWDWSIVAVMVGMVALIAGAWLNRPYLRELVVNRGPLRRGLPFRPTPRSTAPRPGAAPAPGQPPTAEKVPPDATPERPRNRIR